MPASSDRRRVHVSIHAPARGATLTPSRACDVVDVVSIHAPARGATTVGVVTTVHGHGMFRSTPLREGRPERFMQSSVDYVCFDPRPCARGDTGDPRHRLVLIRCFDPRPCARGDSRPCASWQRSRCFDPRPCARGDPHGSAPILSDDVSIHAPARGATVRMTISAA